MWNFTSFYYFVSKLGYSPGKCEILLKILSATPLIWNEKLFTISSGEKLCVTCSLNSEQSEHWVTLVLPWHSTTGVSKAELSSWKQEFSIAFGLSALFFFFVQATNWSNLAELFQERLEHVLEQYLTVIVPTQQSITALGNHREKWSCLTVLVGCSVTAHEEDVQLARTDFGEKLNFKALQMCLLFEKTYRFQIKGIDVDWSYLARVLCMLRATFSIYLLYFTSSLVVKINSQLRSCSCTWARDLKQAEQGVRGEVTSAARPTAAGTDKWALGFEVRNVNAAALASDLKIWLLF